MARRSRESFPVSILFAAHIDNSALHFDTGARIGTSSRKELGVRMKRVVPLTTGEGVFGGNVMGFRTAAQKMIYGDNIFCYELRPANPQTRSPENHYAPADWDAYEERFWKHSDYIERVRDAHSDIVPVTDLATLMAVTKRKIGSYKTVEGLPEVSKGSESKMAKAFARAGVVQVGLLWNQPIDVGIPHHIPEGGLTDVGKDVMKAFYEIGGIKIFDGAHANTRTQRDMVEYARTTLPGARVINSHTGIREGNHNSRNIEPRVAREIMSGREDEYGIVGVAFTKSMLGRSNADLYDGVHAIDQLVFYDPTDGRRVVLGLDTNGIAPASAVPGLTKIHEIGPNLKHAFKYRDYTVERMNNILGWNGEHFLYTVFASKT